MAVYKSKDAWRQGTKPWCCDIYKGSTRIKRYFATESEAKDEHASLTLSPVSKKGWDKIKVGYLVQKYRDEICPTLAGYKSDVDNTTYRLNRILNEQPGKRLCGYSLSQLIGHVQGWEYIRSRQRQDSNRGGKVTARTISRERNLLQRVFATAIEEWGFVGLTNPFADITIKGSKHRRTRRLEEGEYDRLMESIKTGCYGTNKFYVALAVDIAIDTGMREQEVFNLEWRDINFDKRTIRINKSKTDYLQESPGRTIVLPFTTLVDLVRIHATLEYDGVTIKPNHRIFPMTQSAIIQAFEKAVIRAELDNLQYLDLRREANSRWDDLEPPLTLTQRKTMMGQMGKDADINDVYSSSNLTKIRHKLDKQVLDGMTFEEKFKPNLIPIYDVVKAKYWTEPAPLFKTKHEAIESIDKIANDKTPPTNWQREFFHSVKLFNVKVLEYGDNPTEEQMLELYRLAQVINSGSPPIERKQKEVKSDVKKVKLVPRDPNWTIGGK